MARFQVFVPSEVVPESVPAEQALRQVGIEFGRGVDQQVIGCGPDEKPGRVFAWLDPRRARIGYQPDAQKWIPSAQSGDLKARSYWIGLWNDSPPTEQDLRRTDHRAGEFIELGNGEQWLITTPAKLDRYPDLQEDGTINWCVDPEFNWLVTDLQQRRESLIKTGAEDGEPSTVTIVFDDEADFHFLCRLLAINYRITPEVCAMLRLFTQNSIRRIVAGLMGLKLKDQ